MIKKIKSTQLIPGMFVHHFACRWLENPFFKDSILIKDTAMIEKIIVNGIHELFIDTEKGLDALPSVALPEPVVEELPDEIGIPGSAIVTISAFEKRLSGVSRRDLRDELPNALKLREAMETVLEDVFHAVSSGRNVDVAATREVSEKMVESVFRNESALPCVAKTRQAERHLITRALNVSTLMIAFAKFMGMQPEDIVNIAIGSLLHDVGMLKVDQDILKKAEKLTVREHEDVKMHVLYSYEIIFASAGEIQPALQMALLHHERFDGAGYSHGVKGEAIPKTVRMLSIVDVFDAMTTTRAFGGTMNLSAANRKLVELAVAGQVDNTLVQWFIRCIGIYPVGTIVRLSTGKIGVVIQQNPQSLLKPVVNVVYDGNKDHFVRPRRMDLSEIPDDRTEVKIESTGWEKSFKIDPVDFLLA